MFVIEANIVEGSLGDVVGKIQQAVTKIELPPGYQIRMGGDAEEQAESYQAIGAALIQAIILTYMLLAALSILIGWFAFLVFIAFFAQTRAVIQNARRTLTGGQKNMI